MAKVGLFLTPVLLAVFMVACAPGAASTNSPAAATQPPIVVSTPTLAAPPSETVTPPAEAIALPVATSRGPDLEATDPTTVSMRSGGLQFVEFFEFW